MSGFFKEIFLKDPKRSKICWNKISQKCSHGIPSSRNGETLE